MNDQVSWIKRLNQRILENLTDERSALLRQLEEFRRRSEEIQKNLEVLDAKKDQILAAEKLQIDLLSSTYGFDSDEPSGDQESDQEDTVESSGPVKELGKLKARVGDQRYLVLDVFRSSSPATINHATFRTKLPERRVRDAIVADLHLGVLEKRGSTPLGEETFGISEVGLDLMRRFDDYRRQKGLPLPRLPDLSVGSETVNPDEQLKTEGGVFD